MICEKCGHEIKDATNFMYICGECGSSYVVGDDDKVLIKYIVNDEFQKLYKEKLQILAYGTESEKQKVRQELILLDSDAPFIWNALGVGYRGENKLDQADKCYTEALKRNPKYYQIFMNRGVLRSIQGRLDESIDDYEKALLYMPENSENYPSLLGNYGCAIGKKGDLIKAEELLHEAEMRGYKNAYILRDKLGIKEVKEPVTLGGLFAKVRNSFNQAREEAAVKKAYYIEQEKRKPHIKKIKHERPLTMEEQLLIDKLEVEAEREALSLARHGADFWTSFNSSIPTMVKIQEIRDRAVWIEEVTIPPEIDPSVPIVIDEDAIRRSVRKL